MHDASAVPPSHEPAPAPVSGPSGSVSAAGFEESTPPVWRAPLTVALVSLFVLVGTTVADIAADPTDVVLTVFLGLAPLIAAAALPPTATAGFAVAASILAAVSRWWNGPSTQYWVRLTDVVLVGALAVGVSVIRTRREEDLRTSRHIASVAQQALLPVLPSRVGVLRCATRYHSATEAAQIGGDFYDFVADERKVRLVLGDVSGKGIDAVTQSARVIRAFRQYAASEPDLLSVAQRIDAYVRPFWDWEFYATAVLVEVDDSDLVSVVSAGHPPPLHVSRTGVVALPVVAGVPFGLGPADAVTTHAWQPLDRILLYTDGLVEARDEDGRFLPMSVVDAALQEPDPERALDEILERVRAHAGRFADDLALVLLTRATTGATSSAPMAWFRGGERSIP